MLRSAGGYVLLIFQHQEVDTLNFNLYGVTRPGDGYLYRHPTIQKLTHRSINPI
jgi:hypothetical protein